MELTDESAAVEREALHALIASDGWRLFLSLIDREYGAEATLAKQDAALRTLSRGDAEGISDTVQQIQVARREVLKMVNLPKLRVQELTTKQASGGRFSALRRVSR